MKLLSRSVFLLVISLLAAGTAGFLIGRFAMETHQAAAYAPNQLRSGGYDLINPLLIGDLNTSTNSPSMRSLQGAVDQLLNSEQRAKHINTASVYVRDLVSGQQLSSNGSEEYYPASLLKIQYMIAYFKDAEAKPDILNQRLTVEAASDANRQQEISPKSEATVGQTYTVLELINYMIMNSDNNAANTLLAHINTDTLNSLAIALHLPAPTQIDPGDDYLTAANFAYFLRVLYNGTYLGNDASERVMELLSKTDFRDGIVAGLPTGITVAHKFGLISFADNNNHIFKRELHDCGIIYLPSHPYLLCVMTKSYAPVPEIEQTIQTVSRLIYNQLRKASS